MQNFRFRLEKVLEWYRRQYELEERRFHECLAVLDGIRAAIAALEAERLAVERDVISLAAIPAREFAALGLYRMGARNRELELTASRQRSEAELEAQRVRMVAAQRRVRLIEKLRERRVSEYDYAERRELEELASDAFFAKWSAR